MKNTKIIDDNIWEKLPDEAQSLLRANGFMSQSSKTFREIIQKAMDDGKILVDPIDDDVYGRF